MNKVYSKNMNINEFKWNKNDLCAAFVQKYGNWYRGKIVKLDSTKTATVSVTCLIFFINFIFT